MPRCKQVHPNCIPARHAVSKTTMPCPLPPPLSRPQCLEPQGMHGGAGRGRVAWPLQGFELLSLGRFFVRSSEDQYCCQFPSTKHVASLSWLWASRQACGGQRACTQSSIGVDLEATLFQVSSQYFWSGPPWDMVARSYVADTLNAAGLGRAFAQTEVFAVRRAPPGRAGRPPLRALRWRWHGPVHLGRRAQCSVKGTGRANLSTVRRT
jgi:hypothetical protein